MIRTLGNRHVPRAEARPNKVSVWDLGKGPYMGKRKEPRAQKPQPAPLAPVRLCRECDREADVRNYGNYCSRACAKAGVGE